ncbi:UPF0481 protein At3g47200-like [Juglans regia]|uniref:UPF0481 protein At3g47200-like n=1 Tax=Juglans regia TaxID=51240 RepID=A0A6P9ELL6_JUGRE|nr:UPF0481 protein At3g47200-like [Juglans regia]
MILLDASFIIEYFWKNKTLNWTDGDQEILEPWLCNRMQMDFILLENQLPFFIIEKIYDIAFPSRSKNNPFIGLTFRQFEYYNVQISQYSPSTKILHFTDLVRNFCMPPSERRPKGESQKMKEMYSATQLDEVGLKFKMSKPSSNLSPLELKYVDRVLEVPRFQLDDTTEIYARNLVALEKYHYPYKDEAYITNYYTMLSFLIKTDKDLDVLVREQIIDNWLDGIVATSMINKLSGETRFYIKINSHYHTMAEELNKFYISPWNLIPSLKRALFRTNLAGTITISSAVGLILIGVESACSVLSLKYF